MVSVGGGSRAIRTALLVALGALSGCVDGPHPDQQEVRVDTLPSGVIRVVNRPSQSDIPPPGLELEERFYLGSVHGSDSSVVFGHIDNVEVDSRGQVYVLDDHAAIVRVFSPDGGHIRDLGGSQRGSGPGEFRLPGSLVLDSYDRLWVKDRGNGRYVLFDRGGSVVDHFQQVVSGGGKGVFNPEGVLWEPVTRILDVETHRIARAFRGLIPRDGALEPVDSMRRPDPSERHLWHVEYHPTSTGFLEGGPVPVPFLSTRIDGLDPTGGYWTGETDEMRFTKISQAGDTVRVVERDVSPIPLEGDQRTRIAAEAYERYGEWLRADPDDLPENLPAWSGFVVDPVGRLWVKRFRIEDEEPHYWDVYDPTGVFLGALEMPIREDPAPAVRGGWVVGVATDEFDVDYVVLYRIDWLQ